MTKLCKSKTKFGYKCGCHSVKDSFCFEHHPNKNSILRPRIKKINFPLLTDTEIEYLSKKLEEETGKRFTKKYVRYLK